MQHKRITFTFAVLFTLGMVGCATAAAPTVEPTVAPSSLPTPAPTVELTASPTQIPTATSIPNTPTPSSLTISDAAGRSVTINGVPQRIISIAPNDTEILFALQLGPKVVAVDDFSDYPPDVKALPKIGGTNGKYNLEQMVALKPDLVLAAGINAPDVIKQLSDLKLSVVVVGSAQTTFDSVFSDIMLVGQITGVSDQAQQLVASMKQKRDSITAKIATAKSKPRVYWELDGTDPTKPYSVGPGNFVNDIIALAGGVNVFASASSGYPQVSSEQVVKVNPEVIVLSDAAYGITVDSVLSRAGWQGIAAVKSKRVYPIDDSLVSRPGPRVVDGLEAAAKLIHPELFP